jgi:hypothetical protein
METEAPSGTGRQNSAVVRVRRNVGGTDSWIGAIVTSAAGADRATSITAGVDGLLRVAGDDYVGITAAVTPAEDSGPLSARALARLLVERRNQRGWSYRGEAGWLGSTFDPALGFVLRSGITTATGAVSYGWFGGSRFQVRGVTLEGSAAVRNSDWRAESSRITASWFGDRRGGGRGELDLTWRHEDVWEPFALGDAMVPGGVHRFLEARLSVQAPGAQRVRGTAELSGGAFYDGYRLTATAAPTWVPSRFVELGAEVEANSVWFPARSQRYVPTVLRLRVRVSPDTRLSLHGLLQRNGALGATTVNVRARYTIRDGNDIYLVYTRGRVGAMAVEDFAWRREGLLMKVSATLR